LTGFAAFSGFDIPIMHSLLDIIKGRTMTRDGRKSSVKDSFDHVTKLKWPLTRGKLSMGYAAALILYSERRTITSERLEEKKYMDVVFFLADFIVIFPSF